MPRFRPLSWRNDRRTTSARLQLTALLTAVLLPQANASEQAGMPLAELYRHLHANPELSFQEARTSALLASEFRGLGFDVTEAIGGHGVVAVLENGAGPTLLIRADMDALPIAEETGLPYASTVTATGRDGRPTQVMHACGHDIHMTVLAGTARRLVEERASWSGTLVLIAQPAEERSGGAKAMLADGLFERFPRPDFNLALHVDSNLPAGHVGAVSGYFMANVDSVDIVVRGQGGHGAYPERGKDPVVLAAQLVLALQTIVSRELPPRQPAVVTVGSIQGGTQHNIIPDEVKLQLTLRSYAPEVREQTIDAIRRLARHHGLAAGLPEERLPLVEVLDEHTPASYNDPALTRQVLELFEASLGAERIHTVEPEMVGEDFGRYGTVEPRIPSLMFRLGTVASDAFEAAQAGELTLPSLHSSRFAPDYEPTIAGGVQAMTAAALGLLPR